MAPSSRLGFVLLVFSALVLLIAFETLLLSFSQRPRKGAFINSRLTGRAEDGSGPPVATTKPSAIITLVGGDTAARHAVALLQSLREVNSKLAPVVLLARGSIGSGVCRDQEWKAAHNRSNIDCSGRHTIAEEIADPEYVAAFRRLGAEVRVIDPIPRTRFTEQIPGGTSSFWGFALNKVVVVNYTEFASVVFIDADQLVLRNIDHLAGEPGFTSSYTLTCCNPGFPAAYINGGLWVLQPDIKIGEYLWQLMAEGWPEVHPNGTYDESRPRAFWRVADQDLFRFAFSDWEWGNLLDRPTSLNYRGGFPKIADRRHGYVPDLRKLPRFRNMSDADFDHVVTHAHTGKPEPEGFIESRYNASIGGGLGGRGPPGVVWRSLGVLYDQMVGHVCQCGRDLRGYDAPDLFFTVHFSCLQEINKPGEFASEHAFMQKVWGSNSCVRHYFLLWHAAYRRAGLRLPAPYWEGPPVPDYNLTHDRVVRACQNCQPYAETPEYLE